MLSYPASRFNKGKGKGKGKGATGPTKPSNWVPGLPREEDAGSDRGGQSPLPSWLQHMVGFHTPEKQFEYWHANSTFAATFQLVLGDDFEVGDTKQVLFSFFEECRDSIVATERAQLNPATHSDLPSYARAWLQRNHAVGEYESALSRGPLLPVQQQQPPPRAPVGPDRERSRSPPGLRARGRSPSPASRRYPSRVRRAPDPVHMYSGVLSRMASSPQPRGTAG